MHLRRFASVVSLVMILVAASIAWAGTAAAVPDGAGRTFLTTLSGAEEVPGPGDPDGSGTARITLNHGQGTICYELTVVDIEPARAAHIHEAGAGAAGPVVVTLVASTLVAPTDGSSSGCVAADRALIKEIIQHPEDYYVNVHNAEFPAGALRGQLGK